MSDTEREIGRLMASVDALQRGLDRLATEQDRMRQELKAELHDARQEIAEMRNDWSEVKGGKKVALAIFSLLGAGAGAAGTWLAGVFVR